MVNYNQGKIYKIIDNITNNVYIGSTCEPTLARRLAGHVGDYKRWIKGGKKYVSSFEIIKNNNYDIVLVENYPCDNKDDLHVRERYHMESNECVNRLIPIQTQEECIKKKKEYYQQNIEKILKYRLEHQEDKKEYNKEYNLIYKDKIALKKKEYYNENIEKILKYGKEFKQKNIEHISKYNAKYHINNKDVIKKHRSEKITCECGKVITRYSMLMHKSTKKHITAMELLKIDEPIQDTLPL